METAQMIPARECCQHYQIEASFFDALTNAGLIEVAVVAEEQYVPVGQLSELEKMVRLYYELDINLEGIETITYLLQRMNEMQRKILQLNNQLSLYEDARL